MPSFSLPKKIPRGGQMPPFECVGILKCRGGFLPGFDTSHLLRFKPCIALWPNDGKSGLAVQMIAQSRIRLRWIGLFNSTASLYPKDDAPQSVAGIRNNNIINQPRPGKLNRNRNQNSRFRNLIHRNQGFIIHKLQIIQLSQRSF